jgi:CheY-like chemotaxis protein
MVDPVGITPTDILLVNFDSPLAVREKDAQLEAVPGTPLVAVSRGPLVPAPEFHLRGMLIAARLLGVLERIQLPSQARTIPDVSGSLIDATDLPSHAVSPDKLIAECVSGYRALVVDDSVSIQKSLETYLSEMDRIVGVDFADSGEAALEMAAARTYDLIFLDVMMPGLDGYETCTRLRKSPVYKKTPIIMVSGKTAPLDEVKGVIAGCTTYLTKPVQPEAFAKLSQRVLTWLENFGSNRKPA